MKTDPGQKQFVATVFVVSQENPPRFLLAHHKKYDKWMPPGGHIESDENPMQAAIRETREETGLDVSAYLPPIKEFFDDRATSLPLPTFILEEKIPAYAHEPEHYHIDFVYTVIVPYQEASHKIDEAHGIGWFTREEIDKLPMFENVRFEIEEILKK